MLKQLTPVAAMLALCMPAFAAPVNDDMGIWIGNTFQTDFGGSPYPALPELI
jgi:hypothetical protein